MDEDRVVHLLEEIRDLQRRHIDAYARALANQEESVRMQREAIARARKLQGAVAIAIALVLITVIVLLRYVITHYR